MNKSRMNKVIESRTIYRKLVKEVEKVKQLDDPILRMIVAGDVRDVVWLNSDLWSDEQRDAIDLELAEIIETSAEEARRQILEEFRCFGLSFYRSQLWQRPPGSSIPPARSSGTN